MSGLTSIDDWNVASRFVRDLPADRDRDIRPREVRGAAYSVVIPTPVTAPTVRVVSPETAALLGLDKAAYTGEQAQRFADVFGGNALVDGMTPVAACYGGHQFGHWAGQLGDGRALLLGEVADVEGGRQELQLKGAGPTPYSRRADGRAVLRSSIREFLCSEAMHHLGIPTTRALSLVTTGEGVVRDMFYDGHAEEEPGAIVCRVAPSFLRLGSFQLFAARNELMELRALVDTAIAHHFPELSALASADKPYALLEEVSRRTVALLCEWQRVGFVHGVMNTDNLSLLGLTIDYGPYGWMEGVDPQFTPNTTDLPGRRYAYGAQPRIACWNLARFAEALLALEPGQQDRFARSLETTGLMMEQALRNMWRSKLGLDFDGAPDDDDVDTLRSSLFAAFKAAEVDFTLFFRALSSTMPTDLDMAALQHAFYSEATFANVDVQQRFASWLAEWSDACAADPRGARRLDDMQLVNPKYILRNAWVQTAIEAAEKGNFDEVHTLLDVVRRPYDEQPHYAAYADKRPEWARTKAGCSMLSCSS